MDTHTNPAPWMQTSRRKQFFFENPEAYDYDIQEIAEVLARIPRFAGHVGYSVAAHSVFVAELVAEHWNDSRYLRAAHLHDAAEAFYGDMVSPLRRLPCMAGYNAMIKRCEVAIAKHFDLLSDDGVPLAYHPTIKQADLVALATEKRDVWGPSRFDDQWITLPDPSTRSLVRYSRDPQDHVRTFMTTWRLFGGDMPVRIGELP